MVLGASALGAARSARPQSVSLYAPKPSRQPTYVGSPTCRACHPAEYESFRRTFHRTMTQLANAETIAAPLDGRPLELGGRVHRLEQHGDVVLARLPDPDRTADAALAAIYGSTAARGVIEDVERRVVLTTGSHREQVYWVEGRRPGELRLFPFVWLVREARFIPRRDAFLVAPDAFMPPVRWNSNCIACHAVAGEPGHDVVEDAFDTRTAELGVACEACHGPAGEHVARHRDPVERYRQSSQKAGDRTIVHPARLSPERSAALCGQCHAYAFPKNEHEWWSSGYARSFRAGDTLSASRDLVQTAWMEEAGAHPRIDATTESLFWQDGSIRVGGREYNGLVVSACYLRGEGERKITCTSCHAMHEGDPRGQLAPRRSGDSACAQCHEEGAAHTHHVAGSVGASCTSCHMPKTSYALFSAVRSHKIDSPSVEATMRTKKPNACNLCHLDRSLAWTARLLSEWYGTPPMPRPGDATAKEGTEAREAMEEGAVMALSGDAAVRVLVADALGAPEARGDPEKRAVLLAELVVDPYSAVRFVAMRSLRSLPGYRELDVDFLDPPSVRRALRDRVAKRDLDPAFRALLAARDDRAVTIAE